MPKFSVIVRIDNYYEKVIDAPSEAAAKEIIFNEDNWGDPTAGWVNTSCGACDIEEITKVRKGR
jgi:hypothetical protein